MMRRQNYPGEPLALHIQIFLTNDLGLFLRRALLSRAMLLLQKKCKKSAQPLTSFLKKPLSLTSMETEGD